MNFKYFLYPLAGMLIIAAIIVSCSKQEQPEVNKTNSGSIENTLSEGDVLLNEKINLFKQKLTDLRENPTFKSGETVSVDSAVWFMEAASNQTYGDAATPFVDYAIDSFKITLPATNGDIQYNDILNAYDQMIDSLSAKYNLLPYENKHLVMNDVVLESEEAGTATLGIVAGFGAEGETPPPGSIFLYPWEYGFLQGRCDGSGLGGGSDAAEEIEDKIHDRKGELPPNSYYTEVDSVEVYGDDFVNPNNPGGWDNMYDYLMFFNLDNGIMPNVHSCVSVPEMSFYLFGTEDVIYTYEPNGARPAGKNFISVDLWGDAMYPHQSTVIMHRAKIYYGVLHLNSEPPIDL